MWKKLPNFVVAFAISVISHVGHKANPVCNVLLSVLALVVAGLPEPDAAPSEPDPVVAAVFRDEIPTSVAPMVARPRWLTFVPSKAPVIRGQGPPVTYDPSPTTAPMGAPTGAPMGTPYQPSQPYQPRNPFQAGPDPLMPYLTSPGPTIYSGVNGPQPQRFGFTSLFDANYITPSNSKSPAGGHMAVQEYDGALRYTSMLGPEWVFSNTAQGGARLWDGPATPNLPGSVFRFGWDFLLHSPQYGRWSAQLDFNPSINTDLQASLGREALNLDGSATLFYQVSPQLMLVMGVQYWDRVNNIIIPNAGVVWNPNDKLEVRLLFPKSRISYFIGNHGPAAHWIYATSEYHTEAYQVSMPGSNHDQIQFTDWRVAVGLRSDHGWYDKYIEVGYVFGRQVQFLNTVPNYNLGDGIMARIGVRF